MNCIVCKSITKDKTKNIPCCRNCKEKLIEARKRHHLLKKINQPETILDKKR